MSHFRKAQQLHQAGQIESALAEYRLAVQANPRYAEAHHFMGIALSQLGRHAEGAAAISQAVRIQPANPTYYNNLGLSYARQGEYDKALKAYRAATRLAPRFAEAWFNAANAHKHLGDIDKAQKQYEKTLKLAPNHAPAAYNLGNLLLEVGRPSSAKEQFERAIAIRPDYAEAHNNLGSAIEAIGAKEEAHTHYRRAVDLKPDFPDALKNLSSALAQQSDTEAARNYFDRHLTQKPDPVWGDLRRANISPIVFESREEIEAYRRSLAEAVARVPADATLPVPHLHELSIEPPSQLIYQGSDDLDIKAQYGQLFDKAMPRPQLQGTPPRRSRPHIGFVVTHGHEGVFMKCMRGIVNHFDTDRFEVSVVCSAPNGPAILRKAITNPDVQFFAIPKEVHRAYEALVRRGFDALHYWEVGTDSMNYFLPYLRPAPLQCGTWGWPITSGIPQMDYYLSCRHLEVENADEHYTEQLVRFDKLPTYYYRPPVPEELSPITDYGLQPPGAVYLVAQNLRKVHPDFDPLVAGILAKDPTGTVLFIKDKRDEVSQRVYDRLQRQCGAETSRRIVFLDRMNEARYLNLVAITDVILDTTFYTGGANTAYDAFAASTPYVTLPTQYHRGRYGYAAYQQIGITDAIATDAEDYIAKAVRIATDADYRADLSRRIQAAAPAVFEDMEAVRELEGFFAGRLL